jgi:hypothetical protein
MSRLAVAALLLVLAAPLGLPAAPAAAQPATLTPPPMMFVVDVSSSMGDADSGGTVKLEAAQNSLLTAIRTAATPRQPVGLWTYPTAGDDCGAGQLERAPLPGGEDELDATVRALRPAGSTPTAAALESAVDALRGAGSDAGTLILVSDGESNCDREPCETARTIAAQGFQLQVHTVGFSISEAGREELECVAEATSGRYFDVAEGDELGAALGKLTSAQLDLTVDAPDSTAAGLSVGVTASVENTSVTDAGDVVLAIQATGLDGGSVAGYVAVSAPVRRLGNLAPGRSASQSWSVSLPPSSTVDTLRLRISATTAGAVPSTVDRSLRVRDSVRADDLGPLLAGDGTVAILGDSYASGEGAGGYPVDSDSPGNRCHRSPRTYGADVFAGRRVVIACSGAVLDNLHAPQWKGDGGHTRPVPAQLDELRKVADDTSLVLLSMGGNDIDFEGIVQSCFWPHTTCDPFDADLADRTESLARRLPGAYRSVDAVVNSADAVSRRDGRRTPIVVLAYPSLVSLQDVGKCPHLDRTEADRGDLLVRRLNRVLDAAARTARETGAQVYFAADGEDAFRPDHTLCSDDRYVVPISVPGVIADWAFTGSRKQEMMHPTARGYQALTGALVRWSNRPAPDVGTGGATRVRVDVATDPGDPGDTARGDTITTSTGGFAPGSTVLLELRSLPRAIATTTADEHGTASFTAVLPSDTPAGRHTLVTTGTTGDGRPRQVTAPVDVRADMPWWTYGFLGVSGIAAALSVAGLVRRRRLSSPS